jgi:hypothetical protein
VFYRICNGALHAAITVVAELFKSIVACRAPLQHKFAAVSTLANHSTTKFIKTLFLNLKGQGPLKFKKRSSGARGNHKLSIDTTFDTY